MMLVERARSDSGLFGWFSYEWRLRAALLALGIAGGYSFGNGHTTTGVVETVVQTKNEQIAQKDATIQHKDTQLKAAVNIAGCQQKRGDIATDALNDASIIPGAVALPVCPPVSVVAKIPPPKIAPATK